MDRRVYGDTIKKLGKKTKFSSIYVCSLLVLYSKLQSSVFCPYPISDRRFTCSLVTAQSGRT